MSIFEYEEYEYVRKYNAKKLPFTWGSNDGFVSIINSKNLVHWQSLQSVVLDPRCGHFPDARGAEPAIKSSGAKLTRKTLVPRGIHVFLICSPVRRRGHFHDARGAEQASDP